MLPTLVQARRDTVDFTVRCEMVSIRHPKKVQYHNWLVTSNMNGDGDGN